MKNFIYRCKSTLLAAPLMLFTLGVSAQQANTASAVRGIDAAVAARIDHVVSYSVTEHYAVYRGGDESKPAAEMTVRTDYRKDQGKNYTILAQSGSSLLRNQLLGSVLDNEKQMSLPGTRETVLINSANYRMELKSAATQPLDGHDCLVLALTPRRNSPSLFQGTLWVDAHNFNIVQLEGTAAKSHSFLTGPAQVLRQYAPVAGFPMAAHARATSKSSLLGMTTIKIDYSGYQVQLTPGS